MCLEVQLFIFRGILHQGLVHPVRLVHGGGQRVVVVEDLEKLLLVVGIIDAAVRAGGLGLGVLLDQHVPSRLLIAQPPGALLVTNLLRKSERRVSRIWDVRDPRRPGVIIAETVRGDVLRFLFRDAARG